MTQIKTKIPAEMEPAAVGGMVADSKYIIDREQNKTQDQINTETSERVNALEESVGTGGSVDERITVEKNRAEQAEGVLDGKVATEKQRAEGVEGGLNTRLQTVEQLASISVGGGDIGIGTAADFESDDPEDLAKVPTIGAVLGSMDDEPTAGSENLVKSGGIYNALDKVSEVSKEELPDEDDLIAIKDEGENTIVEITSDGVDAKNLKSNGHLVANAESVDSIDERTEFVHSQKTNTEVEECVEIADNNGFVYARMKTEMVGNDNKEEFILEYDSGDECMKVGEDGLFVNGRKINQVPVIRKLFNYKNIVCCGDSVTEGYVSEGTSTQIYINRVVSDRSYPAQLQKMFPGLTVTTKARAGDDVSAWRNHFYATTDFSEYDLIIFELGLNGYLSINDINTEGTNTYNYRILIQDVRAQNADAVIVLVRSSHFADGWMPVLNYIAQESDCVVIDLMDTTYLNLDSAVYHGYIYQNNEFIFDWAHFTRKGYDAKAHVVAHLIEDKLTDETIYN